MSQNYLYFILFLVFMNRCCVFSVHSQSSNIPIKFEGYTEIFYSYDFANPANHIKQPFLYNYNRHNTFALNVGMIKGAYTTDAVRGNLSIMAGTYANDNMASESGVFKHIFEANVGVKIAKQFDIWLDAGILPSHIGWESPIGKDYPTLTRSLAAENSPAFETGLRLSYTSENKRWYASVLLLNGWQRIERPKGNQSLAFGHQLMYMPTKGITLNSSSFIGNDRVSPDERMRYLHDIYGIFKLNDIFALTIGFDMGAEQKEKRYSGYNVWYSPAAIVSAQLPRNYLLSVRGEYFSDENGIILPDGCSIIGYSLNVDKHISDNVMWRVEGRGFHSNHPVFSHNEENVHFNFSITSSLSLYF